MNLRYLLIAASLLAVAFTSVSAVATHETTDCELGSPPGEVIVIPSGESDIRGDIYLNDRPGQGAPVGTGLITGGGTWIYEEFNGIPGLQTDDSTSSQEICGHESDLLHF